MISIVTQLIYPLNAALLIGLVGGLLLWRKWRRLGGAGLALALLVLLVPSLPLVSGSLVGMLEGIHASRAMEKIDEAEAIIVLGGGVAPAWPPRRAPDLSGAGDRVAHAARLYRAGKAPRVLLCGRAEGGGQLLREWGVPEKHLLIEDESGNTRQNAVFGKRVLERHGIGQVLLVTSAMHMPRAHAAFKAVGVDAIAVPTDFHVVEPPPEHRRPFINALIPSAGALRISTAAIHECLGVCYYWLRGWI